MDGLKVKFFCFGAYSFAHGDWKDSANSGWDMSMPNVNDKINRFLKGKELVSCQMESICRGNNPPSYGLVVKVSYIDKEEQEE